MKKAAILMILCLSLVLSACGTAKRQEGVETPEKDPTVMEEVEQDSQKPAKPNQEETSPSGEEIHKDGETRKDSDKNPTKDPVQSGNGQETDGKKPAKPLHPEDETKPEKKPTPDPVPDQKPEKHEHHYTSKNVPATCTKGGYTKHTCSCGENYISDQTEALGHKYGSWKTTKAPTYESKGEEQRTCSRCGKQQTRSIPKKVRPQLDFDKLCDYAINYAVDTYGYEYWPGMRDGYYPAYTCYITNMEEGYAAIRGCVDDLSLELTARGSGTDQMPFDIEIYPDPDGCEDYYCVQLYY